MNNYSMIKDICFVDSDLNNREKHKESFDKGFFSNGDFFDQVPPSINLKEIRKSIDSPLKKRMSELSLGICQALNNGPLPNITTEDDLYLFTAFAEIETTRQIINSIKINKESLVSPTLFHNSVHNTPLGYFTILNKLHNYGTTISDGLSTNSSFVNFILYNTKLQRNFIVAAGEEASGFYELDKTQKIQVQSAFIAYKIVPNSEKGFLYRGSTNSFDELIENKLFKSAKYVFANKDTFLEINSKNLSKDKNIICEYSLLKDNPTAIAFRLALPFYFNIQSPSLVIEKIGEIYHYFEIKV